MKFSLSSEAEDFGQAVTEVIDNLGGVALIREFSAHPEIRQKKIEPAFEELGMFELEPLADQVQFEAAAMACHAAGSMSVPYPLAERLARSESCDALAFVSVTPPVVVPHIDLPLAWLATDIYGMTTEVEVAGSRLPTKTGFMASPARLGDPSEMSGRYAAVLQVLQAWWMVGLLRSSLSETANYVTERKQFGRPLSAFQAVQFSISDMSVAVESLQELSKYTLWSVAQDDQEPFWLGDIVALRVAMLESANTVLRGSHQLYGAMGFADDTNVSWYSRAAQPLRRLPLGLSQTKHLLASVLSTTGFQGLFQTTSGDAAGLSPDSIYQGLPIRVPRAR